VDAEELYDHINDPELLADADALAAYKEKNNEEHR
jgi:hypothetical protein